MTAEDPGRQQIEEYVAALRKLREEAGQPSLRAMSRTAHYSHTALANVLIGGRLPSLELTLAFVRACGGDEQIWRARWHEIHDRVNPEAASLPAAPSRTARKRLRPRTAAIGGTIGAVVVAVTATGVAMDIHRESAAKPSTSTRPTSLPPTASGLSRPLIPGDDSRFVADVTIPDGTTVRTNQRFIKIWKIQNAGTVVWRDRYEERLGGLQGPGLCASVSRVQVPITQPGDEVDISVTFTAPGLPGSCRVDWKMTNGHGHLYFPNKGGIFLIVNVTG